MKRSIVVCLSLMVVGALSFVAVEDASAGIFGRGRGIFRGAWGSRNVGGGGCGSGGYYYQPAPQPAAPIVIWSEPIAKKTTPRPGTEPVSPR